jgi:lysophospholipase L1-like esterase
MGYTSIELAGNSNNIVIPKKIVVPPRPLYRKVMASPPTTTLTTAATIASPLYWQIQTISSGNAKSKIGGSFFSIEGAGSPIQYGATNPDFNYIKFQPVTVNGSTKQSNTYKIRFYHYGDAIEIVAKGTGGVIAVKIDGEYLSLTNQTITNNGSMYYYYIPFGSVKERLVELICYSVPFWSVVTAQTDTITPSPKVGPRCIMIGDSFAEGAGSAQTNSYPNIFADALGWTDVWQSGLGSTGFLANGSTKYTYRDRVIPDVISRNPDMVVFQGSVNDISYTGAQIEAEARLLFTQVRNALPNCLIVATSPLWYKGVATVTINSWDQCAALKRVVEEFGGVFLNLLEIPLPDCVIPNTLTLAANAAQAATSISIDSATIPSMGSTYKFPDGSRFRAKAISGTGPYTITIDSGLLTAQTSGTIATQVGDSLWTGVGKVGSTTGFGNCDVLVSSDGTHPSVAGHEAIGMTMAKLLIDAIGYRL